MLSGPGGAKASRTPTHMHTHEHARAVTHGVLGELGGCGIQIREAGVGHLAQAPPLCSPAPSAVLSPPHSHGARAQQALGANAPVHFHSRAWPELFRAPTMCLCCVCHPPSLLVGEFIACLCHCSLSPTYLLSHWSGPTVPHSVPPSLWLEGWSHDSHLPNHGILSLCLWQLAHGATM